MIPDRPREKLPNNPLVLVIAQLRFPPLPRFHITDSQFYAPFAESIISAYPIMAQEQGVNVVVSEAGIQNQPGEHRLRFSTVDFGWSVFLGASQLALEARGEVYSSIEDFRDRFLVLTRAVQKLGVEYQTRFGLRFVNELRA